MEVLDTMVCKEYHKQEVSVLSYWSLQVPARKSVSVFARTNTLVCTFVDRSS